MTEIEKCVCGGEAAFYYECPLSGGDFVECPDCERMGPAVQGKEAAIAAWNHDQRGLRLLREVYPFMHGNNYMPCGEDGRCWLIPERIWEEIREWNLKAKEADRA